MEVKRILLEYGPAPTNVDLQARRGMRNVRQPSVNCDQPLQEDPVHTKPNARFTSLALRFSLAAATILGGAILSAGCLVEGASEEDDDLGTSEVVYEADEQGANTSGF